MLTICTTSSLYSFPSTVKLGSPSLLFLLLLKFLFFRVTGSSLIVKSVGYLLALSAVLVDLSPDFWELLLASITVLGPNCPPTSFFPGHFVPVFFSLSCSTAWSLHVTGFIWPFRVFCALCKPRCSVFDAHSALVSEAVYKTLLPPWARFTWKSAGSRTHRGYLGFSLSAYLLILKFIYSSSSFNPHFEGICYISNISPKNTKWKVKLLPSKTLQSSRKGQQTN